jgi:hypothetical protein
MVNVSFSKTVAPSILKPMVVCAVDVPGKNNIRHHIQRPEAKLYLINLFICINFILVVFYCFQ